MSAAESLQVPDAAGVVPPGDRPAVLVAVTLDATDALLVGQTLRSLARDRKTPLGLREQLTRVGSEMAAAANAALVAAGKLR